MGGKTLERGGRREGRRCVIGRAFWEVLLAKKKKGRVFSHKGKKRHKDRGSCTQEIKDQ